MVIASQTWMDGRREEDKHAGTEREKGERWGRERKQQRKGREVVHFCFGRQLTAGKLVKMEAGERERSNMRDFVSWYHSKE